MQMSSHHYVIRLGDKTDHGGEVISAVSSMMVKGKPVATVDCMTHCPKCKGDFAIQSGSGALLKGKRVAHHNDVTACGAKLISSL